MQFGILFSGTLLVEVIYSYPGMGNLMVDAVRNADLPLIQTVGLTYCIVVLADQHGGRQSLRRAQSETAGALMASALSAFAAFAPGSDRTRHDLSLSRFCAIFAGWIAPHDPGDQNLLSILQPPAWVDGGDPKYPLGTDSLGRCVLSRLLYGARTAMMVALFASLGAMIIGSILAHISGYFGGVVDWLIGRLVDVWMSFPPVILSLILMVGLGVGLSKVILAIVLVDWTRFCRVLRSEVLVVTRHDYVAAARLFGFTHWQTIVREVLPATTAAADHARQPRNGDRGRGRGDPVVCRPRRRRRSRRPGAR